MTEQDKDILIGKMFDSPSSLTDEELSMILDDDELKDIYEVSSAVKGALMTQAEMDMAREWRLFRTRLLPKPSPMRWMMRTAAIFLGVLLVSGIIVKLADYGLKQDDKPFVAEAEQSVANNHTSEVYSDNNLPDEKAITAEVTEAEAITSVAVPAPSNKLKSISEKIELKDEIDADEYLRLQQSEIDREIALLDAEIYLDQRDAISEFMGYMSDDGMDETDANIIIL